MAGWFKCNPVCHVCRPPGACGVISLYSVWELFSVLSCSVLAVRHYSCIEVQKGRYIRWRMLVSAYGAVAAGKIKSTMKMTWWWCQFLLEKAFEGNGNQAIQWYAEAGYPDWRFGNWIEVLALHDGSEDRRDSYFRAVHENQRKDSVGEGQFAWEVLLTFGPSWNTNNMR